MEQKSCKHGNVRNQLKHFCFLNFDLMTFALLDHFVNVITFYTFLSETKCWICIHL